MESTPPSSKRMKTRVVRSGGKLESWFSGESELIETFLHETSRKVVNTPKLFSFNWMKWKNLIEVRNLLKEQQLKWFLKMSGNIYPDLVKVFYTNLQFNGDNLSSHVKGVDIEITHEVWIAITGLRYNGLRINKCNLGVVEEFNKMQFYKSCLKNPLSKVRNFSVGGLKLDERLILFIVSWIVTPRGNNHSTLSEEDLVLIYCIMNKVKLNWINIFKDHMLKATRLSDFHYPYAILISKLLHYFEVDLEEELTEVVKPSSEINSGSLRKMGFTKIGGRWVSKDGDQGSPSGAHAEEENEAATTTKEPVVEAYEAGPSYDQMNERITSMSPFEGLMVSGMDIFAENQRSLHELCKTRFQTLDEKIEEVHNLVCSMTRMNEACLQLSFTILVYFSEQFPYCYVVFILLSLYL